MSANGGPDLAGALFVLAPGLRMTPVPDLPAHERVLLDPMHDPEDQVALSRDGTRATTRLISAGLAALLARFDPPSRLTDAVLHYANARGRDPMAVLDDAFDALDRLILEGFLMPADAVAQAQPGLIPGDVVAGFRIVATIRALEDTEVHLAEAADGRHVALKIARDAMSPATSSATGAILATEAAILRHLGGGIAPALVAQGAAEGRAFIASEWRVGEAISSVAQRARAAGDRGRLHHLGVRLLETYAVLHRAGIVHGDIHPGNIVVAEDDRLSLIDFGRGRFFDPRDAGDGPLPPDATRAGIPHYYEPEMARALLNGMLPPAAVPRGEQYSLAALLYHLLTGRHYTEFSAEQTALLEQVLRDAPLPFSACGHAPWPDAERALARAFAKDPAARHADVAAFAGAFAAAIPPAVGESCRVVQDGAGAAFLGAWLDRVVDWDSQAGGPTAEADLAQFALAAAQARGDPDLLASADLWIARAQARAQAQAGSGWPTAALAAATDHARGDRGCEAQAITAFLAGCGQPPDALDFLDGRAGMLWAAAHLLRGGARHGLDTTALAQWARQQAEALWRDIDDWPAIADCVPLPHLGLAHGWAGLIFATLFICPAAGMALPAGLGRRLDELAALGHPAGQGLCWPGTLALPGVTRHTLPFAPGWCSGSAGFVWLWAKAYEVLGARRFLDLAIRAGRHAVDTGVINPDLCCGMTGQGFAALTLFRVTGEAAWLAQAGRLAMTAVERWRSIHRPPCGLRKGPLGTALLLVALDCPERARWPLVQTTPPGSRPVG